MQTPTSSRDLGVYIHVPFCERVCPYCDFAVEGLGRARRLSAAAEREYVDLLLRELERAVAEEEGIEARPLATVYLGGGTPSLLTGRGVERLLGALRERFPGDPEEVTLELNPGTAEAARIPELRAAGVTRLSVGVQSLHDRTLRRLGRAHRAHEALAGLERGLAAGFRSLSADLIYGAPEQSEAELFEDVERTIALGVPHVSAYALTLEPGTPFHAARERLRLPDEDAVVRMSRGLRARLEAAGILQYEISSFAREGHRSRHNERYWLRRDVLGIGVSAASLIGGRRLRNLPTRDAWSRALRAGRRPLVEVETVSPAQARQEALYLGLRRMDGVSREDFRGEFGDPPEAWFAAELAELCQLGLVADGGDRLRLTERGILFADEVFLRFVDG